MKTCIKCHQENPHTEFYPSMISTCKDCHRTRQMTWDHAHRQQKIAYNKNWAIRNPLRKKLMLKAHQAVYKAIKSGQLNRPTTCTICNLDTYCEASHTDYTQPLNITWKCRRCHRIEDSKSPKTTLG